MQVMNARFETGGAPVRPAAQPQTRPGANPAAAAELQPDQQQLAMANRDFNTGNFAGAVDAVDNLIKYFPDSESIPDALYLKGRALYAEMQYKDAQDTFQKICNDFPRSNLFRTARLEIGKCQVAQGNNLAAIATFEAIMKQWPSSQEASLAAELIQDVKVGR
jgi:TolA-binding protein